MTTKIEKGSEVYIIAEWNRVTTVYVRKVIVDSFGKKQGTAHYSENGKMLNCHIYADQEGREIFNVLDVEDINKFAMQKAIEMKAKWINHYRNVQHACAETESPYYHENMKKACEEVMNSEPKVIFR